MKKIFRNIIYFVALIIVGYTALFIFLNEKGEDILISQLKTRDIEATVEKVRFHFPFRISITDFDSENFQFSSGIAVFGFPNPLSGGFIIRSAVIENARFEFTKETFARSKKKEEPEAYSAGGRVVGAGWMIPVKIRNCVFDNAFIIYNDESLRPPLAVGAVNAKIIVKDFSYPRIGKFTVDLTADMRANDMRMDDALAVTGWVDWHGKNMDATVKVKNIDYFAFKPYYTKLWNPHRYELTEAVVSLDSYLKAQDDALTIDYYLILNKAEFAAEPENPSRVKTIKTIMALFRKGDVSIVHFPPIKTKMSKPEFKLASVEEGLLFQINSLYSASFSDKLHEAFNRFFDKTQGTVENGVKNIKDMTLDPTVSAVKEIAEDFIDSFKKAIKNNDEDKPIEQPENRQ